MCTIALHEARERFLKKVENQIHSVALFAIYNIFVRIHKAHRMTPAMAAGLTDRLWEVADIAALVEAADVRPGKPGGVQKVLKLG